MVKFGFMSSFFLSVSPVLLKYGLKTVISTPLNSVRRVSLFTMGSSSSKSFSPNKNVNITETTKRGKTSSSNIPTNNTSNMQQDDDYVEGVVCNVKDINENEMKSYDLGEDGKVLVIKQNGQISAIGSKCTHYGAPLASGALGDGRIRCQWHGACFNIKTGDIEDFPGLDSLPCYQVNIDDAGAVTVRAKKSELKMNKRVKTMTKYSTTSDSTFVIIGGGPSAGVCVETLRQEGFNGKIIMVCKENSTPYDRIKCSKILDTTFDKLQFRPSEFYLNNNIEVLRGVEATKVNTPSKKVTLSNGSTIDYDSLYIATGSKARVIPIPGNDLRNVFTVRNVTDANAILTALGKDSNKDAVILGLSFIALEIAATCVDKAKSVTIIGKDDVPLKPVFGDIIGKRLKDLFEEKGVKFITNNSVAKCIGENSVMKSLELTDGTVLPADVFIMGVGTTFYTEFLNDSGIEMLANGAVSVNARLETNVPNVYAGGDIASAPVFINNNEKAAIGHYGLAQHHGRVAALNMLHKPTEVRCVPYFWTMLFVKSIRFCGHGKFADMLVDGSVEELKFVIFFFDEEGKVISMASCNRDPIVSEFAEFLYQGKTLHRNELKDDLYAWRLKLHK